MSRLRGSRVIRYVHGRALQAPSFGPLGGPRVPLKGTIGFYKRAPLKGTTGFCNWVSFLRVQWLRGLGFGAEVFWGVWSFVLGFGVQYFRVSGLSSRHPSCG